MTSYGEVHDAMDPLLTCQSMADGPLNHHAENPPTYDSIYSQLGTVNKDAGIGKRTETSYYQIQPSCNQSHSEPRRGSTPASFLPLIKDTCSNCGGKRNIVIETLPHHIGNGEPRNSLTEPVTVTIHNLRAASDTTASLDAITAHLQEHTTSLPLPPDGGWGWVVVAAAFVCMVILDGMMYSFGVFYLDLLEYFGESRGRTAWVGSTLMGVHLIAGPFTSMLVNMLGCRHVAIMGSLLAATGFVASAYAPSISMLIVTYGIVAGIGVSMVYIPAIIIVGFYFERRRALANGIANAGSGVGAFIYAPLCRYLQDGYTWRGGLLVLASILLNCVAMAALFRPLTIYDHSPADTAASSIAAEKEHDTLLPKKDKVSFCQCETSANEERSNNSVHMAPSFTNSSNKFPQNILSSKCSVTSTTVPPLLINGLVIKSQSHLPISDCHITSFHSMGHLTLVTKSDANLSTSRGLINRSGLLRRSTTAQMPHHITNMLNESLYRKDLFYSGSVWKLPELQPQIQTPEQICCSKTSLHCDMVGTQRTHSDSWVCQPANAGCHQTACALQTLLGLSLLKHRSFIFCTLMSVLWTTHAAVLAILPDHACARGHDAVSAGMLLSIVGAMNIVGRLVAGGLADHRRVDVVYLNLGALLLGGSTCFALSLVSDYVGLAALSAIFGLCMGVWTSLRPILLVSLLGLDHLVNALGLLAMFQGLALCISAPIAGWLYDVTRSYTVPFLLAGSAFTLSALCCVPMRVSCGTTSSDVTLGNSPNQEA